MAQRRLFTYVFLCVALICLPLTFASHNKRCATCNLQTFEEYKQIRQQQILSDLLKKLEMKTKPNTTIANDDWIALESRNFQPHVKKLIEEARREKKRSKRSSSLLQKDFLPHLYLSEKEMTPQITYVNAERAPWPLEDSLDMAIFRLSPEVRRKYVSKADLHVYVRRPSVLHHLHQAELRVDVYERFVNGTVGDKIASKYELLHGSKPVFPVSIPLNDVQTWFQSRAMENREPFVGVYVEAVFEGENLVFHPRDRYPDNMYLELELFDMPGRTRRSNTPQTCTVGSNETKCCLYDLMIDFEKVGWDFVVAPKRYNAFICNGDCAAQNPAGLSVHGSITSQSTTDFYQCCHPKEYADITIVYVNEHGDITVRKVPGMVASRCGCA